MIDTAKDKLFNQKALCELLNIKRSTLLKKRKEGLLPSPIKIMGQDMWPSSMINRWIIEQNPALLNQVKPIEPAGLDKALAARQAHKEQTV
ncbi:helix-turn-helix transcriptional regulator [Endozoicomonas ascidiicola]|uniref:helix-turn-helix transcriptional regulator n=1 Tax=Endozoicomonas ascidiicola TaxID=1698521 RepID=UPI00082C4D39|nr:hypothetical protein [Endozoicomonas ascidiicola]